MTGALNMSQQESHTWEVPKANERQRVCVCADYDVVGFHMPETMWLPHAQSSVLIVVLARDKARRARGHVE
jgi:hypothetical protein